MGQFVGKTGRPFLKVMYPFFQMNVQKLWMDVQKQKGGRPFFQMDVQKRKMHVQK